MRRFLLLVTLLLSLPSLGWAQAECTKNDNQWSAFLDTGHATVQVRCRCNNARANTYGKWVYQFRNRGDQPVNVEYVFVTGQEYDPVPLSLRAHGVTPLRLSTFSGCNSGLSLFVTVNDIAQPPPPAENGAARTRATDTVPDAVPVLAMSSGDRRRRESRPGTGAQRE